MFFTPLTSHVPIRPWNLGSALQLVPTHVQFPVGVSSTHLTTAAWSAASCPRAATTANIAGYSVILLMISSSESDAGALEDSDRSESGDEGQLVDSQVDPETARWPIGMVVWFKYSNYAKWPATVCATRGKDITVRYLCSADVRPSSLPSPICCRRAAQGGSAPRSFKTKARNLERFLDDDEDIEAKVQEVLAAPDASLRQLSEGRRRQRIDMAVREVRPLGGVAALPASAHTAAAGQAGGGAVGGRGGSVVAGKHAGRAVCCGGRRPQPGREGECRP